MTFTTLAVRSPWADVSSNPSRRTAPRKKPGRNGGAGKWSFRPTIDALENRQLLATTAVSTLSNVSVQFTLLSNSQLQEKMGTVVSDLGTVQGLYQGQDPTGHKVAYEEVGGVLKEFDPPNSWVTVGSVGSVAQNDIGNVFFTQGSTLYAATGVPGASCRFWLTSSR